MSKVSAEIVVSELPKIVLEMPSSIDWVSIASILLTALIVVGTTIMTIRNLTKTIKMQEKLSVINSETELEKSRRELLSKNRQAWINRLRDDVASYISAVWRVDDHTKTINTKLEIFKQQSNDIQIQSMMTIYDSTDHWLAEALSLKAKINLHLNPKEQDSTDLIALLVDAYSVAEQKELIKDNETSLGIIIENIEQKTQKILKTEWERVKLLE